MTLFSLETEARLFGAILRDYGVLEQCATVEADDFHDLHLRFAFEAVRNIQARGELPVFCAVLDELKRVGRVGVETKRIAATLEMPPYADPILVEHEVFWLRKLAKRRAACG